MSTTMTSHASYSKRAIQVFPWIIVIFTVAMWLNSEYTHVLDSVFVSNDTETTTSITHAPAVSSCLPLKPVEPIGTSCSFAFRQQQMQRICKVRPPPKMNAKVTDKSLKRTHRGNALALGSVLLDPERKTLGCIVPNVATPSVLDYIGSKTTERRDGDLQIIPLSEINGKYASWTKYIIVQHPVQRLLAAYHDVAFTQRLFNNITIEAFAAQLAYGEIYDLMPEWVKYSSWCFPCHVSYDFILKMETIDADLPRFLGAIDTRANAVSLPAGHITKEMQRTIAKNRFYNKQLSDFNCNHPDVVDTLLKLYRHDFEMYGYRWSAADLGQCTYQNEDTCC